MNNRVQALTGLRAVAVTLVVLGHAEHTRAGGYTHGLAPLRLIADGRLGVLIFFVLSGFLITRQLDDELARSHRLRLGRFYAKRALRIWPAFYVYLLAIAALAYAGWLDVTPRQLAYAALHLWNYAGLVGLAADNLRHPDGAWYLGHFWTLALEEQFYWLWPLLLAGLYRRRGQRVLIVLIVLIVAVPLGRAATYFAAPALRGQLGMMLHTGVDPILVGCWIALNAERLDAWIRAWPRRSRAPTAIVLVLLVAMPIVEARLGGFWYATYGVTLEAGLAGLLIAVLIARPDFWFSRLLRTRAFGFVGTISFSLYLWQQLFMHPGGPATLPFPLGVAAALAAAALSHACIETPFLRIKDRLSQPAAARAAAATAESLGPPLSPTE
jgi:peptidoglycan/LPS O-acetylase OafA/YrhL